MDTAKRVLILTADAGFGHRSASMALDSAFRNLYGDLAVVRVDNPLDHKYAPALLHDAQSDYDRITREMPELYRFGYDLSDGTAMAKVMENGLAALLYRAMKSVVEDFAPDVIVSTYPYYSAPLGMLYQLTKIRIPLVCVITDLATVHRLWFSAVPDLTVVPTPRVRELAWDAGIDSSRIEMIGIPVNPDIAHDVRSREELRRKFGWSDQKPVILAVGSKRVTGLRDILTAIDHSGFPFELAVVTGGDEARLAEMKAISWHHRVHLYGFTKELPSMLKAADLVISKAGGLIISESLAVGRSMLMVDVLPGQEVGNAEYVTENDAGEMVKSGYAAIEALCHLFDRDGARLRERTANAAAIGKPEAAGDIARRAWELARRGPSTYRPRPMLFKPGSMFWSSGEQGTGRSGGAQTRSSLVAARFGRA